MHNLDQVADRIRANFAAKNSARDTALERSRTLIRHCANAIRATHRNERDAAREHIAAAKEIVDAIRADLAPYPDLYHAGYTQDALKEFAEANIVYALVGGGRRPDPAPIDVEYAASLTRLG